MLSSNPKPSHGSRISKELVIFTLHFIFVEMKAQSAHVSDPEHQRLRNFRSLKAHLGSPGLRKGF